MSYSVINALIRLPFKSHEISMSAIFSVINPADNSFVAEVPDTGVTEVQEMIARAHDAFESWRATTGARRAECLERWHTALLEDEDGLARTITQEQGKPLHEARAEVRYGAAYVKWFAEEARRVDGEILNSPDGNKRLWVTREPVGVVAAITPWNFPLAMITRKVAAALAAGCSIVVKPAAETPLTAIRLQELAISCGLPKDLFGVVTTSDHIGVGRELTANETVRKVSFTGSTATGRILMEQSAGTIKRLSLELGGNAPFIVFDDADLEQAVAGAMAAKFRNAGQTCVCANRFLIQRSVFDRFLNLLVQQVSRLKVGNGMEPDTQIGPLITPEAVNKVDDIVADACEKGAVAVVGGQRLGGNYYAPTVLTNVDSTMRVTREEIFGPVAALVAFDTEEEALRLANGCESGLAAYIYTENYRRIIRLTEKLEFGMVGVNEGIISTEVAPFGGVKQSGFGREGSRHGLDDYLSYKYVCLGGAAQSIITG